MYALLTLKIGDIPEPPRVVIRINGVTLEAARVMSDEQTGFATYIFTSDEELPPPETVEEPAQP